MLEVIKIAGAIKRLVVSQGFEFSDVVLLLRNIPRCARHEGFELVSAKLV